MPRGRVYAPFMAAVFFIAAAVFLPGRAPAQETNERQPPVWEKNLRELMWRHRSCVRLDGFLWEVGDAQGPLARDTSLMGAAPSQDAPVALHDVSTLVFAAYIVQRTGGALTPSQIEALTMRTGFNAPMAQDCREAESVGDCFDKLGGDAARNDTPGQFHYGPGHLQKLAMDLDLGTFRDGDMRDEYSSQIGAPPEHFAFETPRLLDGLRMTPRHLSQFLRAVISGRLRLHDHLGRDAVCLDPQTCAHGILFAPAPRNRDYSIGHWVEKNPHTGAIEAYTAAGPSGIYAWISADKKHYGYIIPRSDTPGRSLDGIACGRAMYRTVIYAPITDRRTR